MNISYFLSWYFFLWTCELGTVGSTIYAILAVLMKIELDWTLVLMKIELLHLDLDRNGYGQGGVRSYVTQLFQEKEA